MDVFQNGSVPGDYWTWGSYSTVLTVDNDNHGVVERSFGKATAGQRNPCDELIAFRVDQYAVATGSHKSGRALLYINDAVRVDCAFYGACDTRARRELASPIWVYPKDTWKWVIVASNIPGDLVLGVEVLIGAYAFWKTPAKWN